MKRIALTTICLAMTASILSVQAAASPTTEGLMINRFQINGQELVSVPIPFSLFENELNRSYAIASLAASLDPNGSMAGCAGSVELRRNRCSVQAVLSIERSDDGEDWETKKEKTFTATQIGTTAVDFQYYMTGGHYYRVTLTADTYDENGLYRDTLSVSSRSYYYR